MKIIKIAQATPYNAGRSNDPDAIKTIADVYKADTRSAKMREQVNKVIRRDLKLNIGDIIRFLPISGMSSGPDEKYEIESFNQDGTAKVFSSGTGRSLPNTNFWVINRNMPTVAIEVVSRTQQTQQTLDENIVKNINSINDLNQLKMLVDLVNKKISALSPR